MKSKVQGGGKCSTQSHDAVSTMLDNLQIRNQLMRRGAEQQMNLEAVRYCKMVICPKSNQYSIVCC